MLAQGRKTGSIEANNPSKRINYYARTKFKPTAIETESFKAIQEVIYGGNPTILHHFNPDKQLFLQIDGCLERGFGVMAYHTRDDYKWEPGTIIPSN